MAWQSIYPFIGSQLCCLKIETAILLFVPQLSNHQFEELAMDVYDEVDRRETDAGEISSNNVGMAFFFKFYISHMFFLNCFSVVGHSEPQHTGDRHNGCAFPACQPRILVHQKPGKFLPVCYLWSVRHYSHVSCFGMFFQGRQKLARFSAHEFATLVIDILTDAKRRQWGNSCESPKGKVSQFFSFWETLTFLIILFVYIVHKKHILC